MGGLGMVCWPIGVTGDVAACWNGVGAKLLAIGLAPLVAVLLAPTNGGAAKGSFDGRGGADMAPVAAIIRAGVRLSGQRGGATAPPGGVTAAKGLVEERGEPWTLTDGADGGAAAAAVHS